MATSHKKPVIGIPADRRMIGPHPFHAVGEKYIAAIVNAADCLPMLIPVLESPLDVTEILGHVDGIFFPGSPSNVEPVRYAGPASVPGTLHDPHRDATTLSLIPRAVQESVPVFGVCRGFQEMNVAFGGTLHQRVHEIEGLVDHREDKEQPLEVQYGPAHEVMLEPESTLRAIAGQERITVNSLHWQGVDRLGPDLAVEARATDGLVEAFRVKSAPAFALAVQWHPEWQVMSNPFSKALFAEFGKAARNRKNLGKNHGK
jgi:putative glutamine amidotransferase